jgi:sugar/nucleoside kinase (ribokinase family)
MEFPTFVDYLVVGHICRDLTPDGTTIGGTAAYSAAAAKVLGCRTAVLTSYASDDEMQHSLPDITIHNLGSEATTTFENTYTEDGRLQKIHAVAGDIGVEDVPPHWQRAKIAHIGPVADEVDPRIIALFSNSVVGLTPQGWMRHWGEDGVINARPWEKAADYLPLAAATFISDEDLVSPTMLNEFRRYSKVLVMTQGPAGSIVYFGEEARSFPAPRVNAVDLTGAGDIYATSFLVRLHQTGGDPWEAGRFANKIAALSVTANGLSNKMQTIEEFVSQSN